MFDAGVHKAKLFAAVNIVGSIQFRKICLKYAKLYQSSNLEMSEFSFNLICVYYHVAISFRAIQWM